MKFYIASRLENHALVTELAHHLKELGHEHTYDWTIHGSVAGQGQSTMAQTAHNEVEGVRQADVVIVLMPGGRGTHVELGLGIAFGKSMYLVSQSPDRDFSDTRETCAFYHHARVRQIDLVWYSFALQKLALDIHDQESV